MKRWVVLSLLMIPVVAFADSYWEGDAALQRGDAAFESGLYAASNSFAPDTQLNVQNLDNGKSTAATVTERADGQSDILILLSPKAADAIGIAAGSVARVRVTLAQVPSQVPSTGSAEPEGAFNPDSDVNPAAAYAATPGAPQTAQQPASQGQQQPAQEPQQPAAGEQPPSATEQSAEDAQILAEEASRSPQKQLFLPPREDPTFVYKPAPQAETTETAQTPPAQQPSAAQGEVPTVTGQSAAPVPAQPAVPLTEAQPEPTPQEAGSSTPQPEQPGANEHLALPQTGPAHAETAGASPVQLSGGETLALQAPETPPEQPSNAPAATNPPERQPGQAQVVSSLPRLSGKKDSATFYVQLGAYATQDVAQGLAARFVQTYPVVVLAPASGGKQIYKVLIGPLNKAESGTLLPMFKFRGFRDAFVRRE